MKLSWNIGAGELHADNLSAVQGRLGSRAYVSASADAALDLACSLVFGVDVLMLLSRVKPLAVDLGPLLQGVTLPVDFGAQPSIGDVWELANNGDLMTWGRKRNKDGLLVLPPRQASVCYALAMRRAVRELVYTARPFDGRPGLTNAMAPPMPTLPGVPELGDLGISTAIVVAVLGAAAIAGVTWGTVEWHKASEQSALALRTQELEQAAKLRIAAEVARQKIAAGQDVDLPGLVEAMGRKEVRDGSTLPILGGLGVGIAATVGIIVAVRKRGSRAA